MTSRLWMAGLITLTSGLLLGGCTSSAQTQPTTTTTTTTTTPTTTPTPTPTTTTTPTSLAWPVKQGWKQERIPFPLEFAPSIPYHGVEELRFAPGFFDPSAPGYWSYAFVWSMESGPPVTEASLRNHLRDYFVGLTTAVADGKFEVDVSRIDVDQLVVKGGHLEGSIRTIDAFKTRREIVLNVRGIVSSCGGGDRYVLVSASPKNPGDPIWSDLDAVSASLQCTARN